MQSILLLIVWIFTLYNYVHLIIIKKFNGSSDLKNLIYMI